MSKLALIKGLRAAIQDMSPLRTVVESATGPLGIEGPLPARSREFDQYTRAWSAWSATLRTIADLIEAQAGPIDAAQIALLRMNLFGGMGSFNDLWFDPKILGPTAQHVNDRLTETRSAIYAALENLEH